MDQPMRIAVADDEALMRRWYENTLGKLGHEIVVLASNGKEVVERCRREKPDLLISDIEMPELDGLAAAERLREDVSMPIILVSAHHDPRCVERALQNQVLAYLVKPIRQPDLETAIVLVMRRFQELRVLERQAEGLVKTLEATQASAADVADAAMKLLRSCSHSPVRCVKCRFHEGVLILSGQVPTFFMKQIAQELLRNLQPVERIDNRLRVTEATERIPEI